ncbi:MAG: membrane protein insertion efficiency factor YidD [Verrucomicrobia bacterium]|nr:membrane protein insertion efficiency factor YidD [Verrucomicrobiota bacterium]MBU1908485.1 membrane protein insertion efficiency factor YidD [Verrucomicrobiota bacterium]
MLPGILFFFTPLLCSAGPDLAADLFEEGRWTECSRECRRVLLSDPADETARLLQAVSSLRSGRTNEWAGDTLAALSRSRRPEVRAMAAYELGRVVWAKNDAGAAFDLLRKAFLETRSQPLFLRSGCSLHTLLRDFPTLGKNDPSVLQSLETCRPLWTLELREECASPLGPQGREPWVATPGRWVVTFYRNQIAPAIGARCSLEPSCSVYFLAASRKHGLLGLPMLADRLVREPSVVAEGRHPVQGDGPTRFADPVSDHDAWFRAEGGE